MKKDFKHKDYIKATRRGSREAELENSSGWKAVRKIHKSKRTYTRKGKKKSGDNPDFFIAWNFFGYPILKKTAPEVFPQHQMRKNIYTTHVDPRAFYEDPQNLI